MMISLKWKSNAGNQTKGSYIFLQKLLDYYFLSTVQRIVRLCPDLVTVKVLMEDLNFRELEELDMVEEVEHVLTPYVS